MSNSTGYL